MLLPLTCFHFPTACINTCTITQKKPQTFLLLPLFIGFHWDHHLCILAFPDGWFGVDLRLTDRWSFDWINAFEGEQAVWKSLSRGVRSVPHPFLAWDMNLLFEKEKRRNTFHWNGLIIHFHWDAWVPGAKSEMFLTQRGYRAFFPPPCISVFSSLSVVWSVKYCLLILIKYFYSGDLICQSFVLSERKTTF